MNPIKKAKWYSCKVQAKNTEPTPSPDGTTISPYVPDLTTTPGDSWRTEISYFLSLEPTPVEKKNKSAVDYVLQNV